MHDIFRISHILRRSEQKLVDVSYRDSSRWILTNIKDIAIQIFLLFCMGEKLGSRH